MTHSDKTRRTLPLIAKAAVKEGYITKDQLRQAIDIQNEEKQKGIPPSLQDIFVRTGMISPEAMQALYDLIHPATEEGPREDDAAVSVSRQKVETETFRIEVSEDRLTARLVRPRKDAPAVSFAEVSARARDMGIVHGLVRESTLTAALMNPDNGNPVFIARGTPPDPGKPPQVAYRFDVHHPRSPLTDMTVDPDTLRQEPPRVADGDLLAEKTPMIPPDSGIDVFGKPIAATPIEDVMIRTESGAEVFEDQLKIFATTSGIPFLSVQGTVSVFPEVSFDKNYGVGTGPVERDSCIRTAGTLTGEYPIRGGTLEAQEIRGARIDVLGRVTATLGITGSVIRAEGDVRAAYIRGSRIETSGSVIVEQEIMDATIVCSGICVCRKSKIVASTIAATFGVRAMGIGTLTSIPCEITVGAKVHALRMLERLDQVIEKNRGVIAELEKTNASLADEALKVKQQIAPLITFHQKAEQAIRITETQVDELKKKQRRKRPLTEEKNLNELKARDQSALASIRSFSEQLKGLQADAQGIPEEIRKREEENARLLMDRAALLGWEGTLVSRARLEVEGTVAAGTAITGCHATATLQKPYDHIRIEEKHDGGDAPESWSFTVMPLP